MEACAGWTAAFSALHLATHRSPLLPSIAGRLRTELSSTVCSCVHSLVATLCAARVVWLVQADCGAAAQLVERCPRLGDAQAAVDLARAALPWSFGYFASDSLHYCLPTKDWTILVHHAVSAATALAWLNMIADPPPSVGVLLVWVCGAGAVCEVSSLLLNLRWLRVTTRQHQGFGTLSLLALLSYFSTRCLSFPYILYLYASNRELLMAEAAGCFWGGLGLFTLLTLYCLAYMQIMLKDGLGAWLDPVHAIAQAQKQQPHEE